ncbi:beta-1,4-N-acetylglucosaminyltransferase-like protein [Mucor ambiguus]|uniref:Beta-1,4-N-acetylglucosaminyltransferase-like protein n=1 Tax=Mucor ambiguus TaxID=91626 RepID=A0A0C9LUP7_9FUNG|nr:beta-1,4-N-acetylglucosaminyltransferase-like protein [Mucor ambiguus]
MMNVSKSIAYLKRHNNRRCMHLCLIMMFIASTLIYLIHSHSTLVRDIGYYTRPLWDKNPNKFKTIPHYYAEDVPMETLCQLHGWKMKPKDELAKNKVYDAIIFSVELDLLEIRIKELWKVVDTFVILESNATFTGVTKNLTFNEHKKRFQFAASKIHHVIIDQYALPAGEGPFYNEGKMREAMDQALVDAGAKTNDLIIMSDVDELPRAQTIEIISSCEGVPEMLHLQLRNYMYSFEFYVDISSWRAHVVKYNAGHTFYTHGQITEDLLSDAGNHKTGQTNACHHAYSVALSSIGWHCSFCFRTIQEFQFKMKSYSHSDRVSSDGLLSADRIQKTICDGTDIFDMPPESYNYKDMVSKLRIDSSQSGVGLPSSLLNDSQRFKFLLPGGCMRGTNGT